MPDSSIKRVASSFESNFPEPFGMLVDMYGNELLPLQTRTNGSYCYLHLQSQTTQQLLH